MDLTQMFLASPDWVKGLWLLCPTIVIITLIVSAARLAGSRRAAPTAAPLGAPPVMTLLPERRERYPVDPWGGGEALPVSSLPQRALSGLQDETS